MSINRTNWSVKERLEYCEPKFTEDNPIVPTGAKAVIVLKIVICVVIAGICAWLNSKVY